MHIQFRPPILLAFLISTTLALPALAAGTADSPAAPTALAGRVSDIDLDAGRKSVALAIDEARISEQHEGLLGFALHPEFGMGNDHEFVYAAYTDDSGRSKIVQYYWDAEAGTLGDPVDLVPDGMWVQGDGEPGGLAVSGREGQGGGDYRESE